MVAQSPSNLAEEFAARGYLPARPILDAEELAYLRDLTFEDDRNRQANEAKTLWISDPKILGVARKPGVAAVLDALLGARGYYLWGAQVIDRAPGQVHAWHTDIETAREGMVSLWVGVAGVSIDSSLQAIPGSHRMPAPIQAYWPGGDPARLDPTAEALCAKVREVQGEGTLERIDCSDGAGVFFDGRLWHGTFNATDTPRRALLLQYGRHGAPVRRARNPRGYPFEYETERTPVVLPLKGEPDPVANKNVTLSEDGRPDAPPARTAAAPALAPAEGRPWTPHPYFQTETPIMERLSCHASALRGGFVPHLPHAHDDEEILIVLSGAAAILTPHDRSGVWRGAEAGPGDVFYYPSRFPHTIMNAALGDDAAPLVYLMFRWRTRRPAGEKARPFRIRAADYRGGRRLSLDRPSSGLGKLHVHASRLEPGAAHPRHLDRYDSTFVVLTGKLSVLDMTLGPGGAFLTRAGELHDTANRGDAPCEYLVFEFHATDDPSGEP